MASAQKATMKLYERLWPQGMKPAQAIGAYLIHLAETLDRQLSTKAIESYLAVLTELTREQNILAFSRATEECKFFPAPALLREFSGLAVTGDPIAREAKEKLLYFF
jgi:hypothetical protein